ncbi:MAG: DUF2279 domain-containing protein [Flavobacteriales bacterium]|nr:DUF2279 domain-containing protein [Flavobacteriales bacterium]
MRWTAIGATTAAAAAYIALDQAWYAQYDRSSFHFFEDADEWLQMDKTGHLLSCYAVGTWGHAMMKHCGASDRSARWLGGSVGLLYMTGIEVLDGTSTGWGFSWSDMATNAAGSALFIGQDAAWGEQRIVPKISARLTPYAAQRPDLLGEGFADRLLKDYNGITLWMSFNLASLSGYDALPPWLNVAVGYGAEGMVSARPLEQITGDPIFRQFYLAPDIDLTRIRSRSKTVRTLLFLLNSIKVPLPGLEYRSTGEWKGHWLCF